MRKGCLANTALLAGTLLVAAVFLEGALRLAFRRSMDFSMEMWKYAVLLKQSVPDPNLAFVHRPNSAAFLMGAEMRISSQGLRDREYSAGKPEGVFRVVMLGDSTTLGWGVKPEETAAKVLERELNRTGPARRYEILNAGTGNYGAVQEAAYYKARLRRFQPDLVILVYFINDAEPVPRPKEGFLIDHSYLVAFSASRWDGLLRVLRLRPDWRSYYTSLYDDAAPGWRAARRAISELAATARQDRTRLLAALLPELHILGDHYPFAREHAKVRAAFASEGVPVIDLMDGLRGHGPESTLWVTPLDPHPCPKAHALIAAQLLPIVARESTLAPQGESRR